MSRRKLVLICLAVVLVGGGIALWWYLHRPALPPGFAGGNGRLEAQAINVAAKYPGRLKTVIPHEGDTVDAGQVVATIDIEPLEAQLRASKAQIVEAQNNLRTARAQVSSSQAQLNLANKEYKRAEKLVATGAISAQERDADFSKVEVTQANLVGYQAQVTRAQSAIDAQTAESERLQAVISDNTLRAPVRARVQSRMHEPGEVVAEGAPVLSLLDLSDVFMYVFLPTSAAGKVSMGSDARIVLMDDPMRGVDVGTKLEVYDLIRAEARHGGHPARAPGVPARKAHRRAGGQRSGCLVVCHLRHPS